MKLNKLKYIVVASVIVISQLHGQLIPQLGNQRAGTSSLQFLKIGVGGRATAMGESFVAVANDITALYWKPGGIMQFSEVGVHFSHTEWLVELQHEFFGGIYRIGKNNAIGLSIIGLH